MTIPREAARYFWGDDLQELDPRKHFRYVVQTLLERGDAAALQWLFSVIDPQTVRRMLPDLKLSKRSEHFWTVYLT